MKIIIRFTFLAVVFVGLSPSWAAQFTYPSAESLIAKAKAGDERAAQLSRHKQAERVLAAEQELQANKGRWAATPALKISVEQQLRVNLGNVWMQSKRLKSGRFGGNSVFVSESGIYCLPIGSLLTEMNCYSPAGSPLGTVQTRLSDF